MYLVELIIKKWLDRKKKKSPAFEVPDQEENLLYENCERHVYMAIDSTCDFLACKNCGHIIRNAKKENSKKTKDLFDNF